MALKSKPLELVREDVPVHETHDGTPTVRVNLLVKPEVRQAWKLAALQKNSTVTDLILEAMKKLLASN